MRETEAMAVPHGNVRDVLSHEGDVAGMDAAQARERFDQVRLAVALDPGDADDLAAAHAEAHMVHGHRIVVPQHGEIANVEHDLARGERLLVHLEHDGAPHHHFRQFVVGCLTRYPLAYYLAGAQHADAIGHLLDLMQLVGDEHQRLARIAQRLHDFEELGDLLRRQHGGRLVEDQHFGGTEEHLDNLDALLDADGQFLDDGVGIDLEAIFGVDRADLFARLGEIEIIEHSRRLDPEHDVFGDGEHRNQHEMLVDHADSGANRVAWSAELHRLAVDQDLALVGPIHPGQHVHHRRLAGAVFAEQAEHLSGANLQVDTGIGDDVTEAFGDAAKLDFQNLSLPCAPSE